MADIVDKIMDFETGAMSEEEAIKFFQELINSGMAWRLQGMYGRTAQDLIDRGLCKRKE